MYGTILAFIKFNNFETRRLNEPRHLFHSFCCTTGCIFDPLHVYESGFNTDKYGSGIMKCDQICQKGSYTRTVSRHTFHPQLLVTSMHPNRISVYYC